MSARDVAPATAELVSVTVRFADGTEYKAEPKLPANDVAVLRGLVETYFGMASHAPQLAALAISNLLKALHR